MVPRKNAPSWEFCFFAFLLVKEEYKVSILLEYVIVFVLVLLINTFVSNVNKKNLPKGVVSPELFYLKKIYNVNINKVNKEKILKIIIFINSFIITTIYIIIMYLLNGWGVRVVVGVLLLILMIIICYGLLGRYYSKKEGK